MIKFFVMMIAMVAIESIISYLKERDNTSSDMTQNDINYIVCMPTALTHVCLIGFGFGMFLFCFSGFLYLKQNPTVTMGHLYLGLTFSAICLLTIIGASRWKIYVNGKDLAIMKIFHRNPIHLSVDEISRVEIGKKQEIILYDLSGKKVVTVDRLTENYSRLCRTLGIAEPS